MGRSNRDVGGYRGRRTITDILRFIAVTLAVIVVLVLAGVVYLQRYLVYTPDGPKLELPPFLQALRGEDKSEEPGNVSASGSVPGVGDASGSAGGSSGSQQDSDPIPEPPEPETAGYALTVTVDELLNGAAAVKLEQPGAKAVVVEMKDQLGQLAWNSGERLAGQAFVNGPEQTGALSQWNGGEGYTIARVHCFRDDTVPYYRNPLALRWAGKDWNWRDELGLRWTSPAQEEVRAYNAALCGELAAMGFDEIVLEEFYFPIHGDLSTIRRGDSYNSSQFSLQLEDFLSRVQQAVEPYGTKISLRVERDTLAGAEEASGVTARMLEQYAFRLWVEQDGLLPAPLELLEQAGITGGEDRLVLITAAHSEDSTVFQAELPPAADVK